MSESQLLYGQPYVWPCEMKPVRVHSTCRGQHDRENTMAEPQAELCDTELEALVAAYVISTLGEALDGLCPR